jgi:hypothetical protein
MTREQERSFDAAHRILRGYGLVHFSLNDSDYEIWRAACTDLTPEALLAGATAAKDFVGFFNIGEYRALCKVQNDLPEAYSAYAEACNAGTPKEAHPWSHPAVYWAGKAAGWSFLREASTSIAFPRWKGIYAEICRRVNAGEALDVPVVEQLELKQPEPSTRGQAGYQRFRALMTDIGLAPTEKETTK